MRIPAPAAARVTVRYAPLSDRDHFEPPAWASQALRAAAVAGWWEFDPTAYGLPDGDYEYEFLLDANPLAIPDPYAQEINRFGGYRGIFRLRQGALWTPPFRWDDEFPGGVTNLPPNNQTVIYEMPLRWMEAGAEDIRQVGLGTFDETIFEKLDNLIDLGINAIELLPIMDSPDTLNWGYGTRFFFAPDIDMGTPIDAKFFIKRCHQRGVRVMLDIVMNHHRECPLSLLADDWFFLQNPADEGRNAQFGELFRYVRPAPDGSHPAQDFMLAVADHWINDYHIDGFRIDAFRDINNWNFVQAFRDHAWQTHQAGFPDRPFIIIAEDSRQRAQATQNDPDNPNMRKVVDAIWGFRFRDEIRRIFYDKIITQWGQPSRAQRLKWLVSAQAAWDNYGSGSVIGGFDDMAEVVNYVTSHDVSDTDSQRFMNYLFGGTLSFHGLASNTFDAVRNIVDDQANQSAAIKAAHADAIDWVRSGFAILMTAVGIPMFLAGEEFADVHDVPYNDDRYKMSDPISWQRQNYPERAILRGAVRDLIRLRTSHTALQRNEVEFFYVHPDMDAGTTGQVLAYCRTAGKPVGQPGQVVVVVNAGSNLFPSFDIPWPWQVIGPAPVERGAPVGGAAIVTRAGQATLSLAPYQTRVFTT